MSRLPFYYLIFTMMVFVFSGCEDSAETNITDDESLEETTRPTIKYDQDINWMTWQDAYEKSQTEKKKVFVDLYTDWCGWCKRMDKTTFQDPAVKKFINENFIAIKFDAEQKDPIKFRDINFEFTKAGRRGAHGLAVALLEGRMGYPSFVFLDENFDKIRVSPGYKKPDGLLKELEWIADDGYMNGTFEELQ